MYIGSIRFFKHLILILFILFLFVAGFLSGAGYKATVASADSEKLEAVEWKTGAAPDVRAEALKPLEIDKTSEYASDYPTLYAGGEDAAKAREQKTVYLTFDDGPSKSTPQILKILDDHQVKATFFVIGKTDGTSKKYLKEIADQGHTIGLHSYSHSYGKIYQSVGAFLSDYEKLYKLVKETTGVECTLFRFPGGSINGYSFGINGDLAAEMMRRGFTYFDWDVSCADTAADATAEGIEKEIVSQVKRQKSSVVLLHDVSDGKAVLEALPEIIETLRKDGYTFEPLDETVKPCHFYNGN